MAAIRPGGRLIFADARNLGEREGERERERERESTHKQHIKIGPAPMPTSLPMPTTAAVLRMLIPTLIRTASIITHKDRT